MSDIEKREKSCGAVVFNTGELSGRILMIKNKKGRYSFPKGHVESGEDEIETSVREIFEETGVRAAIDTGFRRTISYLTRKGIPKDVVFFIGQSAQTQVVPQMSEVLWAGWMCVEEALKLPMLASDGDVLRAAIEYAANSPSSIQKGG